MQAAQTAPFRKLSVLRDTRGAALRRGGWSLPTYSDTTRRVFEAALEYLKPQLTAEAHRALAELFAREEATPDKVVLALACRAEAESHDH